MTLFALLVTGNYEGGKINGFGKYSYKAGEPIIRLLGNCHVLTMLMSCNINSF